MQKSSFLCLCYILRAIRAGRRRERRYADHIFNSDSLQNAPYRSQIFKKFLRLRRQRGIDPPNQNPADVPGPPSLCRICCVRIVSSTHHGRGSNRPHSVAAIGDSHDCWSTELANAGKSPTRRRRPRLRDVSYTFFAIQQDDSHTGRGRVERRRRDLRLRRCSRVEVERNFGSSTPTDLPKMPKSFY